MRKLKERKLFKGESCSREDTVQENTVNQLLTIIENDLYKSHRCKKNHKTESIIIKSMDPNEVEEQSQVCCPPAPLRLSDKIDKFLEAVDLPHHHMMPVE